MFITLEDETSVANLVVWTNVFEKHRRIVLGATMLGVRGQVQREGDVIHVVVRDLTDLSPLLATVGSRQNLARIYQVGRADVVKHGMGPDPRDLLERYPDRPLSDVPEIAAIRGIKVRAKDFG